MGSLSVSLNEERTSPDNLHTDTGFDLKPAPTGGEPGDFLLATGNDVMWTEDETPGKKRCFEGTEAGGPAIRAFVTDTPHQWSFNNDDGVIKIIIEDIQDEPPPPPEQEILACFQNELKTFFFD